MSKWDASAPLLRALLYTAIALILGARWMLSLTDSPFFGDTGETITMAHNLAYHGVISGVNVDLETQDPPPPRNYREPLPAVVPALLVKAVATFTGPRPVAYFKSGEGARVLKLSNILWGAVTCAAVAAAIWAMAGSTLLSASGALMAGWPMNVDTKLAESPAAALIALASLCLMLAIKNGRARDYGLAGLALGALVLTKGAFQYITLVLFLGLVAWLLARVWRGAPAGPAARNGAFLGLAVLLVVVPWMARNYIYLGTPQITQRAGEVLLIRATKNAMTDAEAVGAIYAWAPRSLKGVVGWGLGFAPEDLKKGGRLQRLNRDASDFSEADKAAEAAGRPEDAISYYRKAQAERQKLELQLNAQGIGNAKTRADGELSSRAMAMILADPVKHLAMTPLFLWRGAAQEAPFLVLAAILALWRWRGDLLAYVTPALLMIAFYALLSHNIPRYNNPCFPVVVAGLLAALAPWFSWLGERLPIYVPGASAAATQTPLAK